MIGNTYKNGPPNLGLTGDEQPELFGAGAAGDAEQADPVQKSLKEGEDLASPDPEHIELGAAKSVVARAKVLSGRVFKEAKRLPPYKGQLATRERLAEFAEQVLEVAILENKKLSKPLEAPQVREVATGVCAAVARYEHSRERQQMRQALQVAARRKKNRGRDLQIVRMRENGLSLRAISENVGASVGAVRKVLDRARRAASNTSDTAAG